MRPEEPHVVQIKRELDVMLQKNTLNKKRLMDLLEKLSSYAVDTEMLQRTQIGKTVNNLRKAYASAKDINLRATKLIKDWKHLVKSEHESSRRKSSAGDEDAAVGHKVPAFVGPEVQISSPESITSDDADQLQEQRYSPILDSNNAGNDDDHAYFHPTMSSSSSSSSKPVKRNDDGQRPAKIGRSQSISSESSSVSASDSNGNGSGKSSTNKDEETRNKSIELLRQALLSGDRPPTRQHPDGKTSLDLATDIERHIYEEIGNSDDRHYKSRIRSRVTNLLDKKNGSLRNDVLTGALSADRIARMSVEELANEQMKQQRRSIEEESIRARQITDDDEGNASTDTYQCEKCAERDSTYTVSQESVEGDFEPTTVTQVLCNKCGHRWRVI